MWAFFFFYITARCRGLGVSADPTSEGFIKEKLHLLPICFAGWQR